MSYRYESETRAALERLRVDKPEGKEAVRRVLLARKREELIANRDELRRVQRSCIALFRRVDYSRIRPALRWVVTHDERRLWTYCRRIVSSAPFSGRPGRAVFGFCVDLNTNGIMGIVDVGSDVQALGPRERYIGWSADRKWIGLSHIVNVGTCVCVQPFGCLTGGKYQISACMSSQVVDLWRHRYGITVAAVDTTSLFGRSSVYNRVPGLEYVGDTPGVGVSHATPTDLMTMRRFVRDNSLICRKVGTALDVSSKLEIIARCCQSLGIDQKSVASHQPRGVYVGALGGDSALAFLRGDTSTDEFAPVSRRPEEVEEWWLSRWYSMRWPKQRDSVQRFDYSVYGVDAQIDLCCRDMIREPKTESGLPVQQEGPDDSGGSLQ